MILKKPDGSEIGVSIRKNGSNVILFITGENTGARTREELDEYIRNKADLNLGECEIVVASERERSSLREAGINVIGL